MLYRTYCTELVLYIRFIQRFIKRFIPYFIQRFIQRFIQHFIQRLFQRLFQHFIQRFIQQFQFRVIEFLPIICSVENQLIVRAKIYP